MPKLTYVVGSGGETRSVDVGDSCSIGSLAGCTIVLDASLGVSRRHAQILRIQNGYELADLGSTNGTKVNGDTVKKRKLVSGDLIEIGRAALKFEDGPAAEDEISLEEDASSPAPAAASKAETSASDQCMIVFAGGDRDGQKVPLDKPRITFGRNAKNVVQLNDAGTSGFHAEIAREGGAYVLRDLGSTNGTLVDGEPVSETALQHGARIRMGATRFVFVDPTVSDFEKAMAAVDDLGSEWGLLRAEMDMTRVQEARRSQAVMIGLVLVIVVGGGAYVVTHPDVFTGEKVKLAAIDQNKVDDFSFEDRQGAGWENRPGTPTKSRAADSKSDGPAKQGTAFFSVARDGATGTCAAAQTSATSPFLVSPGRPVEFGASVRTAGGALAGVRIVWIDKPDREGREIGRNASTLTSSNTWQDVKSAAVPPDGARAARLELINAAGGTAYFDDVFLVVGAGNPGGGQSQDNPIAISVSADGQATISRGGAKLLVNGDAVGGALRGESVSDPSRRGDRPGSQTIDSGGVSMQGKLVDPASGELQPFTVTLAASGGRNVDLTATLPGAEAAWVATLPDEFVAAGVGVRTESDFRRVGDPYLFEKVQHVSFGGQHRFKVSKGEGCGPLRFAIYRAGDAWEVGFGVTEGKLVLRIDTDSSALGAEIAKLSSDADAATQQRRFGVAIATLKQLAGFLPAGSAEGDAIDQKIKALELQGKSQLEALQKRAAGAIQFRDETELSAAAADAEKLGTEFAEHDVGVEAAKVATSVATASNEIRLKEWERRAAPLLRKAADFAKFKMPTLAEAFYKEVVERFPGTAAEKTAREALAKPK